MPKQLTSEIVVIGAGGSGLTAAVSALEAGAKNIIVLEKRAKPGGNAVMPDGLFAVESYLQKRFTLDVSKDEVFHRAMQFSHWKLNAPLVRKLIDRSADTIQWLHDKGINFTTVITHYPNQIPDSYHSAGGPGTTGSLIVKTLTKLCQDSGKVKILTETAAKKIVLDREGKIAGVVTQTSAGELNIKTRSVVVCTGGFSGNEELIKRYDPTYSKEEIPPLGIPHNGDGVLMASEIGAALDGMVTYEWEEHSRASDYITVISRRPATIWINTKGQRFIDESYRVLPDIANAITRQPGRVFYSVFDESIKKYMLAQEMRELEHLFLNARFNKDIGTIFPMKVEEDLQKYNLEGTVKIADSWSEIARWMGIKPAILSGSIKEYNGYCDSGHDAIYAKERTCMMPLRTPPFYAIKCGVKLTVTHGGIKINQDTEVLDMNDEPIPGLYAAGVETGATDWDTYNMVLSGHSFGFTINTGRIAGEQAAAYIARR